MCYLSFDVCPILHVTCHLSQTATVTATYPLPFNSPTMHRRHRRLQNQNQFWNQKTSKPSKIEPSILAVSFLTRGIQSTRKRDCQEGIHNTQTNIAIYYLIQPNKGQFSENPTYRRHLIY